ncbi:GGDEF domain-containing protein [Roseicyclus marinus]|uniref:GGDEF domain-containing protein n=1 Tax=Roseicyclus marinus TaxID=2161673 RepID=UPI00240F2264|nr:GGDEF domain-containing protein [Roseicyclus marinus]MDG3043050.1 GGDEF domain-containing protein [Roseicyclus marinus]
MRSLWPLSLHQIVPVTVLLCIIGGASLFLSLVALGETIAEVTREGGPSTPWTATQVDATLSEFRTDIILASQATDGDAARQVRLSFDHLNTHLNELDQARTQDILERANAGDVVPSLFSTRDEMAEIIANTPSLGDSELSRLYDLATEAQRRWHPYTPVILEAARLDELYRLEIATSALGDARNHLLFGLFAAIGAGLAVTISSVVAQRNKQLLDQIAHDKLTGCYSRRGFEEIVAQKLRDKEQLSIAVIDINGLKKINDTQGHSAGDTYIRYIGHALRDGFRKDDCVARAGGDEFWIAAKAAQEVIETKLRDIERSMTDSAPDDDTRPKGYGFSFGVASLSDYPDVEATIAEADRRMYDQKEAIRRPRLVAAGSAQPS